MRTPDTRAAGCKSAIFLRTMKGTAGGRRRYGRISFGGLIGGLAGFAVGIGLHYVTQLEGLWKIAVPAAAVGLAVGILVAALGPRRLLRAADLITEAEIEVPGFGKLTFKLDSARRDVAWKLFIELATRIATQPLASEAGFLREALTSLHNLFATTRDLLKGMTPSEEPDAGSWTVEQLAVLMLNRELRPFLAQWHPRLSRFEAELKEKPGTIWPDEPKLREELEAVRKSLVGYAHNFGKLAQVAGLEKFFEPHTPSREPAPA